MNIYRMSFEELVAAVTDVTEIALDLPPEKRGVADALWDLAELLHIEVFIREFNGTREEAEREFHAEFRHLEE